jgi:hypothetical protein
MYNLLVSISNSAKAIFSEVKIQNVLYICGS